MKKSLIIFALLLSLCSLFAKSYTTTLKIVAYVHPHLSVSENGHVDYSGEANISTSFYQGYKIINISAL